MTKNIMQLQQDNDHMRYLVRTTRELLRSVDGKSDLSIPFIRFFLTSLVTSVLMETMPKDWSKQKQHDHIHNNYKELKKSIEDLAADAFSNALSSYSGKNCEYYCQITVVPNPVNKISC